MTNYDETKAEFADGGFGALFDFSFRSFVTLSVVKVLYVLLVIVTVLVGLIILLGMLFSGEFLAFLGALIVVPIVVVIYILMYRVMLELIVVIFRIGENTSKIARSSAPAAPPSIM